MDVGIEKSQDPRYISFGIEFLLHNTDQIISIQGPNILKIPL